MSTYDESAKIGELVSAANKILILQADNPDADSLGSALALEQITHEMGKEPILCCGVDMPTYLHYFPGWDRVDKDIPNDFDLSIIVDCSSLGLFESLTKSNKIGALSFRPCIVLDHHDVEQTISFATVSCNKRAVATGEVIFEVALDSNWPLNHSACERITSSILADSLGLMSSGTTVRSIQIIADLVGRGVKLAELEDARRTLMRKSPELIKYKGELLQRIEYYDDNKIAIIVIPWEEIEKYSQAYNPSMLVLDEMRLAEGNDIAIAFKLYNNGRITAKIRCNYGITIANNLAQHFGGGGHAYASGFRIMAEENRDFQEVKNECIEVARDLLAKMESPHD